MGEIDNKIENEFWTKHSLEIANDLFHKMQVVYNALSTDALTADSKVYVKLSNIQSEINELYEILNDIVIEHNS